MAERDGFLENCATRIAALINAQLRSPTAEEIKREIGAALDQTWPGGLVWGGTTDQACGLKQPPSLEEQIKSFHAQRDAYRQELRRQTCGISDIVRGVSQDEIKAGDLVYFHNRESLRKAVEALEQEAEVEIRKSDRAPPAGWDKVPRR
jgi:hypothetical protein